MVTNRTATLEDLYRAPDDGKYELIGGRLVRMSPTGARPGNVALNIVVSLRGYQREIERGCAFGETLGFIVDLPHRQSFSPDAAYKYDVSVESDDLMSGAPDCAVEVHSKGDYGPAMDAAYAAKRTDYFAAGTRVAWDVSPCGRTIACYTAEAPNTPRVFAAGDMADAEPALPGWRVPVDALLR